MSKYSLFPAVLISLSLLGAPAEAKVLSQSVAKVKQMKISLSREDSGREKPTAWGIESTYIGPGDIRRLLEVDIYMDSESRVTAVKVTRESVAGDVITLLFTDVLEISVETVKEGSAGRQYKETKITIHTADDLTFP